MQVIFQTGAHSTEHERLLKCLLGNRDLFAERGVVVPGPGRYRPLLNQAFDAMDDAEPADDAREVLVDAILDAETADRVVLLNTHFFGNQRSALGENAFYPMAEQRVSQMRQLFEFDQVELFMAIRNPASFVPAVLTDAVPARIRRVMDKIEPTQLRWSELFERIRAAAPDVPITVWCNEDAPLIWSQIIREVGGLEHNSKVVGGFSLLSDIMTRDGMARFRAYLQQHKDMSEMHRRRIIAAFLDKYAKPDEVEEEIDLPGWTEDLIDDLTEIYDEDVFAIQRIPGVQFITP